jgi:hypothetical protein
MIGNAHQIGLAFGAEPDNVLLQGYRLQLLAISKKSKAALF